MNLADLLRVFRLWRPYWRVAAISAGMRDECSWNGRRQTLVSCWHYSNGDKRTWIVHIRFRPPWIRCFTCVFEFHLLGRDGVSVFALRLACVNAGTWVAKGLLVHRNLISLLSQEKIILIQDQHWTPPTKYLFSLSGNYFVLSTNLLVSLLRLVT